MKICILLITMLTLSILITANEGQQDVKKNVPESKSDIRQWDDNWMGP